MRVDACGVSVGRCSVSAGVVFGAAAVQYFGWDDLLKSCLFAAFLHEMGHLFACFLLHIPVRRFRLTLVGAELALDGRSESGWEECIVAAGGPLVNLLCCGAMVLGHREQWMLFAGASLLLGLFNLIPVRPLDGSRILHGLLSLRDLSLADVMTERVTAAGHWLILLLSGLLAVLGNPSMLFIALWMVTGTGGKVSMIKPFHQFQQNFRR